MSEKQKLLILAGAAVHKKLVMTAKEMGLYTIVTDNLPIDKSPAKKYADECWMIRSCFEIIGKIC